MNSGSEPRIRLVIADDSHLLREGIAEVLAFRGFQVVAKTADATELLRAIVEHRPDVALVDIRMPPTHTDEGLRAAEHIGTRHPGVGVLILSEHLDVRYATRLLETEAPGRGYLLKETVTELDTVADAIRRVAAGESVVDRTIVHRLLARPTLKDPLDALSGRERQILGYMAEGRSNRGIAQELVVSERTVENHVHRILYKLGVPDTPDDHKRVLAVLAYLRTRARSL